MTTFTVNIPNSQVGRFEQMIRAMGWGFRKDETSIEQEKTFNQQQMVKESLTRAFEELHSGKVHDDARKLFAE